ncbi:phage head-tail connector protein [Bradyrhizobium neotropicale]|uniref:phage head-tail connector protein n=1 Tax=Bradyrhizobium neotropicale TaxID=1497615 RepID=UPI001AD7AC89|nr:phage head-tail connector protein [Bradyrhizobium neotropicale]MBO4221960.1 hypothetical protein [Bradyrhizobium neotropicale]
MADITVKVLEPAVSYDLLTLDELKTILGISTTDTSEDALLEMWIDQYSDVIATMCNRVFAREKVQETWRGDLPPQDCARVFLTHYPVVDADIESVTCNGATITDYEIENRSGKLTLFGSWSEPIVVVYSGGYLLPDEAPAALKTATGILVTGARSEMSRSTISGIKSISHRESRVQFFDESGGSSSGAGAIAAAGDTVNALLYKYMRFYV